VILAWLVHLYTASGVVLAFLAARAAIDHDYRAAFFWLGVQIVVDATDGVLARLARVSERIPWFDGAKLDDIVDYLTYVFVPALLVWRALIVPDAWTVPVAAAMLLSSAYAFNRDDAKTADHFFTGFPSYWNLVVFYLVMAGWSQTTNLIVLLTFVALVFVPIRYVYPSRTPAWRGTTIALGLIWAVLALRMLWQYPDVSRPLFWASLLYPVYYAVLSFVLQTRRAPRMRPPPPPPDLGAAFRRPVTAFGARILPQEPDDAHRARMHSLRSLMWPVRGARAAGERADRSRCGGMRGADEAADPRVAAGDHEGRMASCRLASTTGRPGW
jgi:phosphatidylcholine synthase